MTYQLIQYETRGDVALITLNRPEKLNAWTPQMSLEQVDAIERANADRSVGAIVMTGAGRGFCAGADMERTFKERIDGRDPGGDTAHGQGGMPAGIDWVALCRRSKPLRGGGERRRGRRRHDDDPALRRDRRFGEGPLRHAVHQGRAGAGAGEHAPADGENRARQGERDVPDRPRLRRGRGGVVGPRRSPLVAPEALLDAAIDLGHEIAANPDPQLRMTKELLARNACETDLTAAQQREHAMLRECWKSVGAQGSRAGLPREAAAQVSLSASRQQAGAVVKQPTYWLTRFLILRLLGLVYLFAFLSLARQVLPLIGEHGLTPIQPFLKDVVFYRGSRWEGFKTYPSLFWLDASDLLLLRLAWLGCALALTVVLGYANAILLAVLWALYMSFVHVGQVWYGYGWEIQLLETGFLAIFLCQPLDPRPFPRRAPPTVVIWLFRWLIFRIMLGAGLIKIRGDACWRDLTCLYYHYETQPIPNPLSWYAHFAPRWFHRCGVIFNHVTELGMPWLAFGPRLGRSCRRRHHARLSDLPDPQREPLLPELLDDRSRARLLRRPAPRAAASRSDSCAARRKRRSVRPRPACSRALPSR